MSEPIATPESEPMELLRGMIARGAGNTPDAIMLRLLWLRQEHPAAKVTTEALHIADDRVVMRATIALPGGGAGSGIAAATITGDDDWAARVEGAETIAISRALDTLGYVLRAAATPAPTPTPHQQEPPAVSTPEPEPETERPSPVVEQEPAPAPPREPARVQEAAPPVVNALRRARRPQAPEPSAPEPDAGEDDVHLEEYSWNAFWTRARELGLSPNRVTEILGRQANSTTPREAIEDLIAAGVWPHDGES